jgi:uncharacterized protein
MSFNLVNNTAENRFEFDLGDGSFAFITYKISAGNYLLLHTEVPEAHGGKGIAIALAEQTFGFLRNANLKAKIYCAFLLKYLGKHPEWNDIVYQSPEGE